MVNLWTNLLFELVIAGVVEEQAVDLHKDNAPGHNALSMKCHLAARGTPVFEHALYSPDLTPCNFFLFPEIKSALERTRFELMEEVKLKSALLRKFPALFYPRGKTTETVCGGGGKFIRGGHSIVE